MSAGKKLNTNVIFEDPTTGERVFYKAGDTPDPKYTKLLGDHLFGDAEQVESPDYSKLTVNKLNAEIDDRNEDRDEADKIVPDGATKPHLVAALEADDEKAAAE